MHHLTIPNNGPASTKARQQRGDVVLVCVAMAVSVVLHLWFERLWLPGYDEHWHLFLAELEPFSLFLSELRTEDHPPLSYPLRRLLTEPGDAAVWARLISIVPSVLTLPLLFGTLRQLAVRRPIAHAATIGLGLSHTFVGVGVSMRGYALTMFFLILALRLMVQVLAEPERVERRHMVGFLGAGVAASWTEYVGAIVVVALVAMPCLRMLIDGEWRRRVRDRLAVLRPWPEIVLFGALMVALVVYYKFTKPPYHAHYLSEFMSQDDVGVGMLLLNGLNRNLSAFSALSLPDNAVLAPVVLGLLTVIMLGPGVLIPRYAPQSFARRSVVLVLLVVATEIFFLACIERYPWGGRLRHQYVLFPFLFLWVVLAADALTRRLSLRSSYLVAAVLLAGCIATSIHSHRSDIVIDEYVSRPLWLDEVQELEALIDTPTAIYLSRFDKIGIYRSVREEGGWRGTKQVTLRDGSTSDCLDGKLAGKPMRFYADRDQWQVPARPDQEFAKRLADLAQQEQLPRLLVFTVRQRQPGLATDRREHEVAWRETYQAAGLVLRRLVVIGTGEIHELLRQ